MARYFSHFLSSLLILSIGLSVPFHTANAAKILIMGDSLSASHNMRQSEGWVALLEKRLAAENLPHHVTNASISGETSSGGLNRLPAILRKHQPQIVVLELGANDGLRGLPLSLLQNNLQRMITDAQKNKARVLLLGMRLPPSYGLQYTKNFAQVFADLAQQYKTAYVPFFLAGVGGQSAFLQNDRLHPNIAAQEKLLDTVWPYLLPLLKH